MADILHPSGSPPSSPMQSSYLSDDDAPDRAWQGGAITFMRSNQHSKERRGRWDTTGERLKAHGHGRGQGRTRAAEVKLKVLVA
jgi:hypothetical protein